MFKMVYICSPFRGNEEFNAKQARKYCRKASELGVIPLAPHLYFTQFLDDSDPTERGRGIQFGLSLLRLCEEIWVFGDVISEGMRMEIGYAKGEGKVIKYVGTGCDL